VVEKGKRATKKNLRSQGRDLRSFKKENYVIVEEKAEKQENKG